MLNGGHNEGEENAITHNAIDVPYCAYDNISVPPPKKKPNKQKKINNKKNQLHACCRISKHLQGCHALRKKIFTDKAD